MKKKTIQKKTKKNFDSLVLTIVLFTAVIALGSLYFNSTDNAKGSIRTQQITPTPEEPGSGQGGSPLVMKDYPAVTICELSYPTGYEGTCRPTGESCGSYDGEKIMHQGAESYGCPADKPKCCIPCGPSGLTGTTRKDDASEQCDGSDLGGATCVSQGFAGGGVLSCKSPGDANFCTFDTTQCVGGLPSPYSCMIQTTCDVQHPYTILKAKGAYNAHVNTATANDTIYPYKVCCSLGAISFSPQLGTGRTSGIISLMLPTGTTVEKHGGLYSTTGLSEYVYLQPTSGTITCTSVNAPGTAGQTACDNAGYPACMFTITDTTNAHIADCSHSEYKYKVCCKTT